MDQIVPSIKYASLNINQDQYYQKPVLNKMNTETSGQKEHKHQLHQRSRITFFMSCHWYKYIRRVPSMNVGICKCSGFIKFNGQNIIIMTERDEFTINQITNTHNINLILNDQYKYWLMIKCW